MPDFQEIKYNPGIFGFVKAHRHSTGPTLVLSIWEDTDKEWAAVYWVKRLHHAAVPINANLIRMPDKRTMLAVNRTYDLYMGMGPPFTAYSEEPDYQRQRVYDWEDAIMFPGYPVLNWEECQDFFDYVWRRVGTGERPKFSISRRFRTPIAFVGQIFFPDRDHEYFWRKPIVLHEIAHELRFVDKHGPQFVKCYIDLCVRFLGFDYERLIVTADSYRVAYGS